MKQRTNPIVALVILLALALTACGASSLPSAPKATGEPPAEKAASDDQSTSDVVPRCDGILGSGKGKSPLLQKAAGKVPATANIFAAGLDAPPAPGGGGGGVLPPVSVLPTGQSRVVTFPRVTGRVNPITMYPDWNGPDGDKIGPTDVRSFQGISGIVHRNNGMFLVGVFLTDAPPSNPARPRFDFSAFEAADSEQWVGQEFDRLAPEIGQTFFIGDGKGRTYVVPAEATRLFLGFADAYLYVGCPGWYGNNSGYLTVKVKVTER
jgi:hypothetical protein